MTLNKIEEKTLLNNRVNLSIASVHNALVKRLRITLKNAIDSRKNYALNFSHNVPEVCQSIIFIDECGFN